jgi:4-amino-4-deoxy-L-arabinose transferase-like glycosyltransferase
MTRAASSVGQPIATFPDTLGYESLSFFGNIHRPWPVSVVYFFVHSDQMRVLVQVIIGSVIWGWCATVLARHSRYPRSVMIAVLAMGLTPQVIRYDLTILSESLTISFVVLLITATINLASQRNSRTATLWLLSLLLCGMARPTHIVIIWACAAFVLIQILRKRSTRNLGLCLVLLLMSLWGYTIFKSDDGYSRLNFYTVLAEQVMSSDARYEWFVQNGMPDIPILRTSLSYDYVEDVDPALLALVELPVGQQPPSMIRVGGTQFANWVISDGWSTYGKYVLNHKSDSLSKIRALSDPTLSPSNDNFLPITARFSFARSYFGDWETWSIVGVVAAATLLLRASRRKVIFALFAMSGCTFVIYCINTLASGIEHPRHASAVAVSIRVIALVAISLALPRPRRTTPADEFDDVRTKKTSRAV